MAQQRILFIEGNRLAAYRAEGGAIISEAEFVADGAGLQAFAEYLQQRRQSLFALLADVAEEGFQSESVPYIQGSDRTAMIKRKLGQYYYGTPLSAAVSQGREKAGRRDEKLIFVALTRPQNLDPWLATLRQAAAQVSGLFTVPLVVPPLAERYASAQPQLLLITLTRAGLRQTFFDGGQLRFSRLSQLLPGTADAAQAAAAESVKIYQYLAGQRLVARGSTLSTLIIAHPADLARFREHCRDSDELRFAFIDLLAVAREHRFKGALADSRCEALLMHLVASRPPRFQLLPPPDQRSYRLWQFRVGLNRAAAVVLFGCLLYAAKQAYDYTAMSQETLALQAQTAADRQRYDNIMQALPPTPLGAENVRMAVNRFDDLERRSPPLEASYAAISRALQEAPRVDLARIDWLVSTNPNDTVQPSARPGGGGTPAATQAGGSYYAIAEIHGLLPIGMANDHRATLDIVNGFVAELRRNPSVEVRVTSMPFDIESGKTLRSDSDFAASVTAPRFSVRMVQKLEAS